MDGLHRMHSVTGLMHRVASMSNQIAFKMKMDQSCTSVLATSHKYKGDIQRDKDILQQPVKPNKPFKL